MLQRYPAEGGTSRSALTLGGDARGDVSLLAGGRTGAAGSSVSAAEAPLGGCVVGLGVMGLGVGLTEGTDDIEVILPQMTCICTSAFFTHQ